MSTVVRHGKKRIGLYMRVSSENQVTEEGSLKSQEQRLRNEVEHRNRSNPNWGIIVKVYVEEGRSAKDTNRPEFRKMLGDIKAGLIDTIMVTELSRFSRSVVDLLQVIVFFEKYKADFVCLQHNFDTTTPSGRVFLTIITALAQFEREMVVERVKNNMQARAERGLFNGGYVPLGFNNDPNKKGYLFVNEDEAATVREIFQIVAAEGSIRKGVQKLLEKNIRNKRVSRENGKVIGGGHFTTDSLNRLLTNYSYIGKKELNREHRDLDQATLAEKDRYAVVGSVWPAIVDEQVFDRAQRLIEHNFKQNNNDITTTYSYILGNLIHCAICDTKFVGTSAKGRGGKAYYYYEHRNVCGKEASRRLDAQVIERFVLRQFRKLTNDDDLLKLLIAEANKQSVIRGQDNGSKLRNKSAELTKLKQDADNFLEMRLSLPTDERNSSSYVRKQKDFDDRQAQLEAEVESLNAEAAQNEWATIDVAEVKRTLELVITNFRKLTVPLQKDLIRQVIQKISITNKQIRISIYGNENGVPELLDSGTPVTTVSYGDSIGSGGRDDFPLLPSLCN